MRFKRLQVKDSDLVRAVEIEFAAYDQFPLPKDLRPVCEPGPAPLDAVQLRADYLSKMRRDDPTVHYVGAYDEDTEQLVAFAKWNIYDTDEAAAKATRPLPSSRAANPAARDAFFKALLRRKEQEMQGRKHLFLHMLHTDPAFQGRGAGNLLVGWGAAAADELGLPAYVEASPKGRSVYARNGFKDIAPVTIDFSLYGGSGTHEQIIMLREPVKFMTDDEVLSAIHK